MLGKKATAQLEEMNNSVSQLVAIGMVAFTLISIVAIVALARTVK